MKMEEKQEEITIQDEIDLGLLVPIEDMDQWEQEEMADYQLVEWKGGKFIRLHDLLNDFLAI